MDYAKESLKLHEQWKGKIEVVETVPVKSKEDLDSIEESLRKLHILQEA